MKRREVITLIGGAAAWPLAARAQQTGKIYHIGFLANDPTIPAQPAGQAFLDGLRESGFIEGKNAIIEHRFSDGRVDRLGDLVAELIRLNVDVLVTSANDATLAAKRANTKIPVVMLNVSDPIGQGIVASLARPGGNITGVIQDDSAEIAAKRLQLLKDAAPHTAAVAVLLDPNLSNDKSQFQQLERASQPLQVKLRQLVARRASEFEHVIGQERPDALLVVNSPLNFVNRKLIAQLATTNRLPTIFALREFTEVGGLMSYGSVRVDSFRRAATYVGKILKGAKPAELPVEQPTKYELVINLRTAKSLGLEIPRDLLLVADEVIE